MEVFTADMVKGLRQRIGCEQKELADHIGCGVRSVSLWESGKVKKISKQYRDKFIQLNKQIGGEK